MAGYRPPSDFNHQPTQRADLNAGGYRPPAAPDSMLATGAYPQLKSPEPELAPVPWYRKRAVLIAWGLLVAILITLIIYGLVELAGRGGGAPTPTYTITNTPSTTTTTTPTTAPTTPSTTTTEPPPSSEPPEATVPPAVPPAGPPPRTEPTRRRHLPRLPKLPSTITVPGIPTVITLPPGL